MSHVKKQFKYSLHYYWALVCNCLNLRQYEKTMGIADYKQKALKVKTITKSKKILALCDELIEAYDYYHPVYTKPVLTLIHGDAVFSRRSKADLKLIIDNT
jgi:hypothetical protein